MIGIILFVIAFIMVRFFLKEEINWAVSLLVIFLSFLILLFSNNLIFIDRYIEGYGFDFNSLKFGLLYLTR
jgi:hypothetical protein